MFTHLSDTDREVLSLGLAQDQSLRTLARMLGRFPSIVSREVVRNHVWGYPYRACTAQAVVAT